MKKIMIIPALAITLMFTDCNKEGVEPTNIQQSKTTNLVAPTAQPLPKKLLRKFYEYGCYCSTPEQNCAAEDVIIKPHFADAVINLLVGPNEVVDYFNGNEWQENFPDVLQDSVLLEDLRTGDFEIEDNLNASTGVHYYLVKNVNTNDLRFAFPLTFE